VTLPIDMSEEQLLEVLHGPLGQTTSYGTAAATLVISLLSVVAVKLGI